MHSSCMRFLLLITLFLDAVEIKAQQMFPDKCVGNWEGTMYIFQKGTLRDSVHVKFTVERKEHNKWSWKTEYLSEKFPMTKDYQLILDDSTGFRFKVDEGEGIALYDYLFENKLYSVFETHEIMLTSTYELTKEGDLVFEVTSGKPMIGQSSDEIKNYTVQSLQRVVLHRVDK